MGGPYFWLAPGIFVLNHILVSNLVSISVTNLISVTKFTAQLPNFPVNNSVNTRKKRCTLRIGGLRPQDYIIILWAVHVHSPLPASSGLNGFLRVLPKLLTGNLVTGIQLVHVPLTFGLRR